MKKNVDQLRIEYVPLDKLIRWPRNPKEHDLGAINQSIERFGFVNPIIVDETSGKIVAGHGRVDTLQQLKVSGAKAPAGITTAGNTWLVPVIRGVAFKSESEAEAYIVADNQLTILGGWDDAKLGQVLADLAAQDGLDGTGFDKDDVDDLLKRLNGEDESPATPRDQGQLGELQYRIVVECGNEQEQVRLLEKFDAEGIVCKALIS
jgi:ParB-like chromosome segregation protein Spo0J